MWFQAVFVMQGVYWVYYATKWRSERTCGSLLRAGTIMPGVELLMEIGNATYAGSFFAKAQADVNMILFTGVSAAFMFFGRLAYVELRSVPVELGIRSRKLKELAIMTTICSSCFLLRSALQIFLSREHVQLHNRSTWFLMLLYYAVLEVIPSVTILYFNRRLPLRRGRPGGGGSRTSTPIAGSDGGSRLFSFKRNDAAATSPDPLRKSLLDDTK
jgi:hypothetical protein